MPELSTEYLGIQLKNPVVVSSSPLTESIDNILRMEDAGASAIVMHSLFEEQLNPENDQIDGHLIAEKSHLTEAQTYYPGREVYKLDPDTYLQFINDAKEKVDIPIIGSLNGVSTGGWIQYAKAIQDAGADGLELNIYFIPTDVVAMGGQVEQMYTSLVKDVRNGIHIPLSVKISPYFSSLPNFLRRLDLAGADGLVLFNRYYQTDIDLSKLIVQHSISYTKPSELFLRLRWAAILFGQIDADIAITGGVYSAEDIVKSMMVGSRIVMITSLLMQKGIESITQLLNDLEQWLETNETNSVYEIYGSMSQQMIAEPAAYERANYLKLLNPDPGIK